MSDLAALISWILLHFHFIIASFFCAVFIGIAFAITLNSSKQNQQNENFRSFQKFRRSCSSRRAGQGLENVDVAPQQNHCSRRAVGLLSTASTVLSIAESAPSEGAVQDGNTLPLRAGDGNSVGCSPIACWMDNGMLDDCGDLRSVSGICYREVAPVPYGGRGVAVDLRHPASNTKNRRCREWCFSSVHMATRETNQEGPSDSHQTDTLRSSGSSDRVCGKTSSLLTFAYCTNPPLFQTIKELLRSTSPKAPTTSSVTTSADVVLMNESLQTVMKIVPPPGPLSASKTPLAPQGSLLLTVECIQTAQQLPLSQHPPLPPLILPLLLPVVGPREQS
eukprot:Filipodium_phascolosomae@DN896_c0_g1_i1.p1